MTHIYFTNLLVTYLLAIFGALSIPNVSEGPFPITWQRSRTRIKISTFSSYALGLDLLSMKRTSGAETKQISLLFRGYGYGC